MTSLAPEALIEEWLRSERAAIDAAIFSDPFHVPFDQLANVPGWAVWLGHPPVPENLPILPIPEQFLWGEPTSTIATSLLVAADYAVRRGAFDPRTGTGILERECPLAIVVPGDLHRSASAVLVAAATAGVPVVRHRLSSVEELADTISPFATRGALHKIDLGRRHDPALSFQHRGDAAVIGGNSRSTFFVHNSGERDGVTVLGKLNNVVGIEIGLPRDFATVESLARLEPEISRIPSFLDGVSSWIQSDSLALGWNTQQPPKVETLGDVIWTYLKTLYGAHVVDVRIVFASDSVCSSLLSDMRSRKAKFRHRWTSTVAVKSTEQQESAVPQTVTAD